MKTEAFMRLLQRWALLLWDILRVALPLGVVLGVLVFVVCLVVGWRTSAQVEDAIQIAAVVVVFLAGLGLLSGSGVGRWGQIHPYRAEHVSAMDAHRRRQMDRSTYAFLVGVLVAMVMYLLSKGVAWLLA